MKKLNQMRISLIVCFFFAILCANAQVNSDKFKTVILRAGTPVSLILREAVSTKNNFNIGNTVNFYVQYDVLADGEVAIPAGTAANGVITDLKRPKIYGDPGSITIKVDKVQAADNTLMMLGGKSILSTSGEPNALSAVLVGAGTTFEIMGLLLYWPFTVIGLPFFIPPFFMKGGHAEYQAGFQTDAVIINTAKIKINEQ